MVRAKFHVTSIERTIGSRPQIEPDGSEKWVPAEKATIKLSPVYSQDPGHENAKFWAASPSGDITLGTVNMDAADEFELGAEYYIDFTKAPAE